ncbi:MAG: response regulator [Desulfobacteraceae bacterium]|nr:response regulator [Desulfobacteraceae bacterium]
MQFNKMADLSGFNNLERLHKNANTFVYNGSEKKKPVIIKLVKKDLSTRKKIAQYKMEMSILAKADCDEVTKLLKQMKEGNRAAIVFNDFSSDVLNCSKPGKGRSFSFNAEFGIQRIKEEIKGLPEGLNNLKIIIVDDKPVSGTIFEAPLTPCNVVSQAASAREAIAELKAAFEQHSPHRLILMDWKMPEMSGIQASEIIHKDKYPVPAIILVTAYDRLELKGKQKEPGQNSQTPSDRDSDTALPLKIDGINMQVGLARAAQNKKLYQELLISFKNKCAGAGDTIKQELKKNDYKAAVLLAHTIKAMAGNLGALDLYDCAIALETSILKNNTQYQEASLQNFNHQLERVIISLGCLKEPDPESETISGPKKTGPMDIGKIQRLLHDLEQYLKTDLVAALGTLGFLETYLANSHVSEEFKKLKTQVNNFHTRNALQTLSDITRQIK